MNSRSLLVALLIQFICVPLLVAETELAATAPTVMDADLVSGEAPFNNQSDHSLSSSAESDSNIGKPVFRLKDEVEKTSTESSSGDVVTMLTGLLGVLGVIFLIAWLSKRFNLNMPGASANMKMISAMSVGTKEKIMLVEVEGEKVLLGVTTHQISLLKSFDTPPEKHGDGAFADKMQTLLKAGVTQHE
jgi:flagellar protein FliO/FliZ